jgi:carbon storage regulator CsrA
MLVLSRKAGETIRIGDDVVVTINRINKNRVSIGIHAPDGYRVLRGELEDFQAGEISFEVDSRSVAGPLSNRITTLPFPERNAS